MKRICANILRVIEVGIVAMVICMSVYQLNAGAAICSGFACLGGNDCGTGCFCNRAIGMCAGIKNQ